jgi:carbonic anhydrase
MAKSPPAPVAAPAPASDAPAADAVAPSRLQRLRAALSRKVLIIGAAGVLGLSVAGAGAYMLWPSGEAAPPVKPAAAKKPRAKASDAAARAASAASQAEPVQMAASSAEALHSAAAASQPPAHEDPMDKLRRRLGETLGQGASLDAAGAGELRVSRRDAPSVRKGTAPALQAAHGEHSAAAHDAGERAGHAAAAHWSYDGAAGPAAWARLKPEFAKCGSGSRQSPIDIRDGIQVQLDPVQFDYKPSAFRVIDNGHTVQVNVAPGNFIDVLGKHFELQQFHFHRPSEERVDGKQFDMVAHLVHKDIEGRLAVVAVLLERGSAQGVIQTVWNNLPLERGEEQAARVEIDLAQLLPRERGYFTYMGSLTTPPCSEGVLWMVMKQPVSVSAEQIGVFSRLYPMNARPIQSAGGRMIKESN